jgi:hypothetical protein
MRNPVPILNANFNLQEYMIGFELSRGRLKLLRFEECNTVSPPQKKIMYVFLHNSVF